MDFAGEPVFVLLSQHAQQIGVFWRFGPYCHYYCTVTGDGWMPLLTQALLSAYHPQMYIPSQKHSNVAPASVF